MNKLTVRFKSGREETIDVDFTSLGYFYQQTNTQGGIFTYTSNNLEQGFN